jgi:hypothetical protein
VNAVINLWVLAPERRRPVKRLLDGVNAETETGYPGLNS